MLADDTYGRDSADYVLHYGLHNNKSQRKKQSDAYLHVQRKIVDRQESARALLISANVMSMSVMASQLCMYRWKVSEAQTITQATSVLHEEISEANRRGYRIARQRAKPMGTSKYAGTDGLQKLYERKKQILERRKKRRAEAAAVAAASGVPAAADEDSEDDTYLLETSSESSKRCSSASSQCSADLNTQAENPCDGTPADAITRLVVVDCYTHEPFTDIVEHLRFMDREFGLELVIVLLLPQSALRDGAAAEVQGAGMVITPQYDMSIEAAYACGYDLVLTHYFDHILVDFLTNTFVSSAGRWRNDVRNKAAVGNYVSLKNVLMGRIDVDALRQLVWHENVDDNDVLDVLGSNSLALRGETRSYARAGQQLSRECGSSNGTGADVLVVDDPDSMPPESSSGVLPVGLHRLRSKESTRMGVRSAHGSSQGQLRSFSSRGDILDSTISVSANRRVGGSMDFDFEDSENQVAFAQAIEKELARLLADNDSKQGTITLLQEEMERMQRTVAVLKNSLRGHEGVQKLKAGESDRPGSASLVNLTKEQQIYILKERLEAANAKITSMMGDNNGRSSRRGSSYGSSRKRLGPGLVEERTAQLRDKRKRLGIIVYTENREGDLMAMHDYDAAFAEAMAADDEFMNSFNNSSMQRRVKVQDTAKERAKNRRDKQQTDDVINSLQQELLEAMHGHVDSRRLAKKLEEALERLKTQKARIDQLENMRKMDEAIFARRLEQAKANAADKADGADDEFSAGQGKARRTSRRKRSAVKRPAAAASSSSAATRNDAPDTTGMVSADKLEKLKRKHAAELQDIITQMSEQAAEASAKAVEDLARQNRKDMQERETLLKKELTELYMKVRKPYTAEYRAILERDHAQATQEARGAMQRLQFTLNNLGPQDIRTTDDDGKPVEGIIAQIVDPVIRQRVTDIAKEHALYTFHAQQAESGVRDIDEATQTDAGRAHLVSLLEQRRQTEAKAQEVCKHQEDPEVYLDALREVAEIDEELSRWADADLAEVLSLRPWVPTMAKVTVAVNTEGQLIPSRQDADGEANTSPLDGVEATDALSQALALLKPDQQASFSDPSSMLPVVSRVYRSVMSVGSTTSTKKSRKSHIKKRKGRHSTATAGTNSSRSSSSKNSSRSRSGKGGIASSSEDGADENNMSDESVSSRDAVALCGGEVGAVSHEDVPNKLKHTHVSALQKDVYDVTRLNYEHGYIHPDRMIDVDRQVCVEPSHVGSMRRIGELYDTHHKELIRLLRMLALRDNYLAPLLLSYTKSMQASVSKELMAGTRQSREEAAEDPCITVPFLMSVDTALTTSIVDLLSSDVTERNLLRRMQFAEMKKHGGDDVAYPTLEEEEAALEDALGAAILRHLTTDDERLNAYHEARGDAVTTLKKFVQEDSAMAGSVDAMKRLYSIGDDDDDSGFDGDEESGEGYFRRKTARPSGQLHQKPRGGDEEDYFMGHLDQNEAGYAAEDLAALFSAQRPERPTGPTPEEIYLEMENDDDPADDNTVAMRNIREELDYLANLRKQRTDELILRYRMRQRQKEARMKEASPGPVEEEDEPQSVPDFEVKSGSPAWYGMEAAKRVKDILRRRMKPDQVIVGGGPDSGAVGIELSRRTAFPRPPPRDFNIIQSATERLRAAHRALPPVKHKGLSRWQQQRRMIGAGDDYYYPRDTASMDAYNHVVSQYTFESMDRFLYTPQEMTERMLEYRANMSRVASRIGTGNTAVTRSLGNGYYVPVLAGPVAPPVQQSQQRPQSSAKPPQAPLPMSKWTYGVTDDQLQTMLKAPEEHSDTVVILPHKNEATQPPQRRGPRVPSRMNYMAGREPAFASPAAMAAARLTALLRVSMHDPTVRSKGRPPPLSGNEQEGIVGSGVTPQQSPFLATAPPPPEPPTGTHSPTSPRGRSTTTMNPSLDASIAHSPRRSIVHSPHSIAHSLRSLAHSPRSTAHSPHSAHLNDHADTEGDLQNP